MQFSSRYDERRLQARPSASPARCFRSLVDWFDYAYAAVPSVAAWVRHPSFRSRARHTPAVIHLRGLFSRDALHVSSRQSQDAPRHAIQRPVVKLALFSGLLASLYLAFAITAGGASRASAPSDDGPTVAAYSTHITPEGVPQKAAEVSSPQVDQSVAAATPVRTLQSAIEPIPAASVTAAEASIEAVKPAPPPIAAAVAVVATAAPETPPAVAPVVTPVPAPASPTGPRFHTAAEIRGFAAAAGWSADQLDHVVQVAWCESTYNAAAIGGYGTLGLMQLMPFWFDVAGIDRANWSDPVSNLKVALVAYQAGLAESKDPWAAWDCKPTHAG